MRRVVSLYLPTWPTDRLRRRLGKDAPPAERPLALVGRDARRRVILCVDRAAAALGLRPGMPAAKARALCADLDLRPADLEADAQALERLAVWALKLYAPVVAVDPPDGLVLDVTGACGLRGGEDGLLSDLLGRLRRGEIASRAAMAGTLGAAHALARFGDAPGLVVTSELSGRALSPLPVRALRLGDETTTALAQVGLDSIGEVEARPRGPLLRRFGPELIQRLDQAFGRLDEPIVPVEVPEVLTAGRAFAEPIGSPEVLARHVVKAALALCAALELRGLGARSVDLRLHRIDNRIEAARIRTARPSRDALRLARLLAEKLETLDPGFGVERLILAATAVEPLRPDRPRVLGEAQAPDVSELIDTLSNRLGSERLYRAAPAESDVPERSVRRVSPSAPPSDAGWPERWPRPSRLLTRPEPIDTVALLPDQPPVSFTWRGVRRRVQRADGPERIFGEWWRNDEELASVRDYFQLEDDAGERFWVFRRGDGERRETGDLSWYLHGIFG